MKKNFWWGVVACLSIITGLFLAIYHAQTQLIFGYDQARDAFEAYAIWHNFDLKILGPSTDIPGVFHGVLWYYFLAIIYFLGRSPQSAALIYLLASFLAIPLVGLLAHKLFKDFRLTCLAISLFALSPLFQIFTHWLSNPGLVLLVSPALLIVLWSYLTKPQAIKAFVVGMFFGALCQAQFAYAILLLLVPAYLWFFRLIPSKRETIAFIIGLTTTLSSFILAEIKFHGLGIVSMLEFFLKGSSESEVSGAMLQVFDRIAQLFFYSILPWHKLLIIGLIFLLWFNRSKIKFKSDYKQLGFLAIWLFGLIIFQLFSTAVSGSVHVLIAFAPVATIIFAYFYSQLLAKYSLAILLFPIIIFSQIVIQFRWAKADLSPLSAQQSAFLSQEQKLIDYTYTQAQGKPFIITTITNPLYINTLWAYLYQFYGQPKYGYLPYWGGLGQTGRLGSLPEKPFGEDLRYLIFEDTNVINDFYVAKITYEEDKISSIVEEKSFGKLKVQKRFFHPNKGPVPLPAALQNVSKNLLEK